MTIKKPCVLVGGDKGEVSSPSREGREDYKEFCG